LRRSHEKLARLTEPLGVEELSQVSYAADWSIAKVCSHLGSGAEIFGLILDASLVGEDAPGPDVFSPIWDAWNTRSPLSQARDALFVDNAFVTRLESLDDKQRSRVHLNLFGQSFDATGLARLRLGEHAVHTWDIAVTLDKDATVAPDAVDLLIDSLDGLAARSGKPDGKSARLTIETENPERHFTLETKDTVALTAHRSDGHSADLTLPAEALVRLVYGRLDALHTPPIDERDVNLVELRRIFPGF
jgi:uncharacterized protein (TIGR03083 family)